MTELEMLPDLDRTPTTLFTSPDPAAIVEQAKRIADVIKPIITERHLYKRIGNSDHVYIDAWTLTGSMLGVFATTVSSGHLYDDDGHHAGAWATVEARTMSGALVGRADAECTRDENEKWGRAPSFQLRSMAQTRASSKALRMPLGFVMQLAGYDATPAEEMEAAAARGETVSGGRGVAKGWRDKAEQDTAHNRMRGFVIHHGVEALAQTIMDSKGYTLPLAKGQMADLRRALDREIEDQKSGAVGDKAPSTAVGSTRPGPHQSDPPPTPPGGGSDPMSGGEQVDHPRPAVDPPPDPTSGVGEREPAAGSAGAPAAPMAQGADRDDPTPDPNPTEDYPKDGDAIQPDTETVGPAVRGEPDTGTASDGTTGAGPSPVQQWCEANNRDLRVARIHLRKSHRTDFGDMTSIAELKDLRGERADRAIAYLEAWANADGET